MTCGECGTPFEPIRETQSTCGKRTCIRLRESRMKGRVPLVVQRRRCPHCETEFTPAIWNQRVCGAKKCVNRHHYLADMRNPRQVERRRERNRSWAAKHRNSTDAQPWLRGAPAFRAHLPGAGLSMWIHPLPGALTIERTRALHGLVTELLDAPHGQEPDFSLVPWPVGCGWGVYVNNEQVIERLASRTFEGQRFFDRVVTVKFSAPIRLKTPSVSKLGRRRVVIDTVTPVVIRSMGTTVARSKPTALNLVSTLTRNLARRLGLSHRRDGKEIDGLAAEDVPMDIVRDDTFFEPYRYAKLGPVTGWEGRVVVDTNATGEWLLRCAAAGLGLGGRTAFGFGRVRVSDAETGSDDSVKGPWFITPHALERYAELTGSAGNREEDMARLARETSRAHHVKATRDDCHLWRGPKPRRLRFIVGPGEGEKLALVTVLPACDAVRVA